MKASQPPKDSERRGVEGKAASEPRPDALAKIAQSAVKEAKAPAKAAEAEKPTLPAEGAGRFVVQVGAFADTAAVAETRRKIEALGLKTYTQSVETPAGKRVRVRIGPFKDRAEAEKAAAKLKTGGLPGAVLTL